MARGVVGLGLGVGLGEGEVRETNASRWSSLWRWADRTFERKPIVAHDRLKAARRARQLYEWRRVRPMREERRADIPIH